ncbi:MAG: hypothetical protein WAU11_07630 [Ignavibacteriaceae bacterium]|jgi:hypothetical protein
MEALEYPKIISNPLSDLISDEIWELLYSKGLINDRSVRDYIIRRRFKSLRSQKVRTGDAIDTLRAEYPYLQFDTIRKIVHNPPKQISRS